MMLGVCRIKQDLFTLSALMLEIKLQPKLLFTDKTVIFKNIEIIS